MLGIHSPYLCQQDSISILRLLQLGFCVFLKANVEGHQRLHLEEVKMQICRSCTTIVRSRVMLLTLVTQYTAITSHLPKHTRMKDALNSSTLASVNGIQLHSRPLRISFLSPPLFIPSSLSGIRSSQLELLPPISVLSLYRNASQCPLKISNQVESRKIQKLVIQVMKRNLPTQSRQYSMQSRFHMQSPLLTDNTQKG